MGEKIQFDPEKFGLAIGETIARMIEPLKAQLAAQQSTIAALCGIAQKHALEYQPGIGYRAGSFVRHANAIYKSTANALPGDEPGGDNSCWQKIN